MPISYEFDQPGLPRPDLRKEVKIVTRLDGFTNRPIRVRVTTWYEPDGTEARVDEALLRDAQKG